MNFYLRDGNVDDAQQKGFVHHTAWIETYTGLMPADFLNTLKLENSINSSKKFYKNSIVALVDDVIAGFVS